MAIFLILLKKTQTNGDKPLLLNNPKAQKLIKLNYI